MLNSDKCCVKTEQRLDWVWWGMLQVPNKYIIDWSFPLRYLFILLIWQIYLMKLNLPFHNTCGICSFSNISSVCFKIIFKTIFNNLFVFDYISFIKTYP